MNVTIIYNHIEIDGVFVLHNFSKQKFNSAFLNNENWTLNIEQSKHIVLLIQSMVRGGVVQMRIETMVWSKTKIIHTFLH